MKPTTKNRWLKLLAWLLVLVIIVMLLIPSDLTNEQLAQIKLGMTIAEATRLLGSPGGKGASIATTMGGPGWFLDRQWWKPSLSTRFYNEDIAVLLDGDLSTWIGKTHLLWVVHKNGIVTRTWLFPITRTGGGLQGCIDTLKEEWNNWWK